MDGWIYPLCTSTAAKAVTLAMVQRGQGAWILQIVSRETMLVPLFLLTAAWHIYNLKHVFFSECAVGFFPPVSSMFFFSLRISPWDHDHMVHKPSNFYNGFLAENMVQTLKPWVSPGLSGYFTYPLVNQHNHGKSQFFMGKFTINGDFP